MPSWFYIKNHGENVFRPLFKCYFSSAYNMPSIVQMVSYIDIWGDSLPTSFPWKPNSEALASLINTQWNPCLHAYFWCINMFVVFSLETVSHTHVASVWSVMYLLLVSISLCLERGLRIWFSNVWLLKWSFKRVFFSVCSYYAGCNLWLASPEALEQVRTLGSQNHEPRKHRLNFKPLDVILLNFKGEPLLCFWRYWENGTWLWSVIILSVLQPFL